ncbi:hypothetical protein L1987_30117 [Smallanthus sonchifolius]|uniref:Uncharacterized protein n=1 Tax=Smallanthus sonchifolius TaxID=185202 RepID=A0ACB9I2M2_9ASTR|nr:hypothetical protein L1987_30117 [Smallanthus sonchifolius]
MVYTNLLLYFLWATLVLQGVSGDIFTSRRGLPLQATSIDLRNTNLGRRSKIGSVIPTCTFNECRGCRHNCRAEKVPVEGNDPMNSAYRYRCVCHRSLKNTNDVCVSDARRLKPEYSLNTDPAWLSAVGR